MISKRTYLVVAAFIGAIIFAPTASGRPDSAEQIFEQAEMLYRQLRQADPDCADPTAWSSLVGAFGRIPAEYPSSNLAGDALWRVGDIHSRLALAGNGASVRPAMVAYSALANRYPESTYAPEAFLRLGDLSDGRVAEAYYVQLRDTYPSSPQADVAARRLQGIHEARGAEAPDSETGRLEPSTSVADSLGAGESPQPLGSELEAKPTPASDTLSERRTSSEDLPPVVPEMGQLLAVRHFSDKTHTRIVFDLDRAVQHRMGEVASPPRVFIDLIGAELPADLPRLLAVQGTGVQQIRIGVNRPGVVRAVLDLKSAAGYSIFTLANPDRLVLDVPSPEISKQLATARRPPAPEGGGEARQLGFGIRKIVIDPGHGGTAPGAIGKSGDTEKALTLDISKRLAENLRNSGYEVLLTRYGDESVALEERPDFATRQNADMFVSVHINSSSNGSLAGFETYYLDLATDPTAAETAFRENEAGAGGMGHLDEVLDDIVKNANKRESRDLAQSIQDSLVLQTSKGYADVRDLGVKHAPFVVLVGAAMPAVLVECSFLSHSEEERRLRDPAYRQQIADAIHIGIANYGSRRRMVSVAH
jgi:N-acetylmuramoyl-L-alanine amidase